MKNRYSRILFIITFIFISNAGFSQSNEIKIRFIGNCGLHLTNGSSNIYVDFPYQSGAFNYMKYAKSELDGIKDDSFFLFTHRHPDHYSQKLVKKYKGRVYGPWNLEDLEKLSQSIPTFSVQSFKTKHRFTFKHYSYLLTWHNKKIFLSGDTENAETIGKVSDVDWAFVPYWILLDAQEKNIHMDTEKFAVYHLYPDQKLNVKTPEKIILMEKQGEVISIPY